MLLSCGHTQHLRHQPPWQSRAWVLDPVQRQRMTGQVFCCGWCANAADNDSLGTENSR
ncbi:Pressure-regulated protein [Pseudomonas syringae pv. maculicola]|nr:Pressure-regulated protein [Pseudomonas syringae pv. maculicola]KPB88792.1 Pressure-regulated protein [Pseudomonas syringae pv. maculicola]KPC00879.1 Pressure-regulated protein [Pseudomonas syringae pv. maculicola str. M6]KPC08178.1 Pressure-regulated protein [Pseudomonas syringae pv. maculicola]